MDMQELTVYLEIAEKAIEAASAERWRKRAQAVLNDSYEAWKSQRDIDRVERDTTQWNKMMKATKPQYLRLVDAKRDERNAKRRLARAIEKSGLY